MNLELEILTPNQVLAKEPEVDELIIPASWGQMDILPMHTDFVTALTEGEVIYRSQGSEKRHGISGGLLRIKDGKAAILADGLLATVRPIKA